MISFKARQNRLRKASMGVLRDGSAFTLLEMLVVLFLLSLTMTLLMQGLSHVLTVKTRLLANTSYTNTGVLRDYWLRQVISAITPENVDGKNTFKGLSKKIHGLSLSGITTGCGVPVPMQIEIRVKGNYVELLYKESESKEIKLGTWQTTMGEFRFLSATGTWEKQWPPPNDIDAKQLPEGIQLLIGDKGAPVFLCFSAIAGSKTSRLSMQDYYESTL